jgi:hypothetical protein
VKKGHLTELFLHKKYIIQYCAEEKLDETGARLEHSPHKLLTQQANALTTTHGKQIKSYIYCHIKLNKQNN